MILSKEFDYDEVFNRILNEKPKSIGIITNNKTNESVEWHNLVSLEKMLDETLSTLTKTKAHKILNCISGACFHAGEENELTDMMRKHFPEEDNYTGNDIMEFMQIMSLACDTMCLDKPKRKFNKYSKTWEKIEE